MASTSNTQADFIYYNSVDTALTSKAYQWDGLAVEPLVTNSVYTWSESHKNPLIGCRFT